MPRTITQQFPPLPLDELAALIRNFADRDIGEKKSTIARLVEAHPTFNVNWGPGWRFRRARNLSGSKRPDHVDGLIWHKDAPATLGRANPAGYRVLYLADRIDTALRETHIADDQWWFRSSQSGNITAYGSLRSVNSCRSSERATAFFREMVHSSSAQC